MLLNRDISSPVLDDAGMVRNDILLKNNIHPNAEGYRIWTAIATPRLEAYFGSERMK